MSLLSNGASNRAWVLVALAPAQSPTLGQAQRPTQLPAQLGPSFLSGVQKGASLTMGSHLGMMTALNQPKENKLLEGLSVKQVPRKGLEKIESFSKYISNGGG